jgi:glycosyltransferase involved in cell wall biosynthesis
MGLSHPFETIVEAARSTRDEGVLWQFIGDGPQRGYLKENLPASAQLIGYQPAERLGEVLHAADICLISQHDGMFDQAIPYKIYAILAAGRPVVFLGNDKSEIARWLRESGAGVQISHGAVPGLTRLIRELAADAQRRQRMGEAGRALFEARFTADRVAQAWSEIVDRSLQARP